jgi:hypothetical protein
VFGTRPSAVATLVDRAARYTIVVALPGGYKADAVARALIEHIGQLPAHHRRSLTWDRGRDMAEHAVITEALTMPVFFCDPHSPWQLTVAARHQRENQSAAAPVSAQERRPVGVQPKRPRRARREAQPPPPPGTGLGHPGQVFGAAEPKPALLQLA